MTETLGTCRKCGEPIEIVYVFEGCAYDTTCGCAKHQLKQNEPAT